MQNNKLLKGRLDFIQKVIDKSIEKNDRLQFLSFLSLKLTINEQEYEWIN